MTTTVSHIDTTSSTGLGIYINQSIGPVTTNASNSQPATITPAPGPQFGDWASLTGAEATCQDSWNEYWSSLEAFQMGGVSGTETLTHTAVSSVIYQGYAESTSATLTSYATETGENVASSPITFKFIYIDYPLSTYTSLWIHQTKTTLYASAPRPSPTPPLCPAPIDSSACSHAWSQYNSLLDPASTTPFWWETDFWWLTETTLLPSSTTPLTTSPPPPPCYDPPINSSYCSTLRSIYYAEIHDEYRASYGYNPGISLARGCTLGCGGCTITVSSFQILYWGTQSSNVTGSTSVTVVINDSMTLTSPQVYVSFTQLSGYNSCRRIGSSFENGIIPIDTDSLSEIRVAQQSGDNWPTIFESTGWPVTVLWTTPLPFSKFLEYQRSNVTMFHLSLPPEIKGLDGSWHDCEEIYYGM